MFFLKTSPLSPANLLSPADNGNNHLYMTKAAEKLLRPN